MRKLLRYTLLGLAGLMLILLLLFGALYWVAVSDQDKVPELVEELGQRYTGADIHFSHYRLSLFERFPFISLVLEDIEIKDPGYDEHHRQLLQLDKLSLQLRFWNLLRKEFRIRSLVLQGGKLTLFRNADASYSNTDFLKGRSSGEEKKPGGKPAVLNLRHAVFKDFSFQLLDSFRTKEYYFDLQDTRIDMWDKTKDLTAIQLKGDWFFHGLTFKLKNGPYLKNKPADLDWLLEWDHQAGRIQFVSPSEMQIEDENFEVGGYLQLGQPPFLKLVIDHPGILLDTARSFIADNIQKALNPYTVEKPMQTRVIVAGKLEPGKQAPAEVQFRTNEPTAMTAMGIPLADTWLEGRFYNCDPDGPVNPHSGCLSIDTLSTLAYEAIPLTGSMLIKDLEDPFYRVDARAEGALTNLNAILPPGRVRLRNGQFQLEIHHEGQIEAYLPDQRQPGDTARLRGHLRMQDGAATLPSNGLTLDALNADLAFDENDLQIRQLATRTAAGRVAIRGSVDQLFPAMLAGDQPLFARLDIQADTLDVDRLLPPAGNKPPKPKTKASDELPDIARQVESLLQRFQADLQVKADQIRMRGLAANRVRLRSRFLSRCRGMSESSCLLLDTLMAQVYGGIPLRASARVIDLDNPRLELNLSLDSPVEAFRQLVPAQLVELREGRIAMNFQYRGLLDDYVQLNRAAMNARLKGNIQLDQISANLKGERYRLRDLSGAIRFDQRHLYLNDLSLAVNENQLKLQGRADDFIPFLFSEGGNMSAALDIRSPRIDLNAFPVSGKAKPKPKVKAAKDNLISRKLQHVFEHFAAELKVHTDTLLFHEIEAEAVALSGTYRRSCRPGGPTYGCLQIDTLSTILFGNAPVRSRLTVENLDDPRFDAHIMVDMPLTDLNAFFPDHKMRFHGGEIDLDLTYRGQPHDHFDANTLAVKAFIDGKVRFRNASIEQVSKGYRLDKLNGELRVQDDDLMIPELQMELNGNPVRMEGRFVKLVPFIFSPAKVLRAKFELSSPAIDFSPFSTPAGRQETAVKVSEHQSNPISQTVFNLLDSLQGDLKLDLGRVKFKQFESGKVFGEVRLNKNDITIREISMEAGDGVLDLYGSVTGLEEHRPDIYLDLDMRQVDLSEFFKAMGNFGQQSVTHANIDGVVDAKVELKARADASYRLDPASIDGRFYLKMEDGELINFPGLRDIHNFLVKNRHLEDLRFAKLEKSFRIKDQQLFIDDMEVISSAFIFKLDGRYDFGSGEKTEILFEVPLRNLFKHGLKPGLEDYFKEHPNGPVVLLLVTPNEEGGLKVKPVLSRKKHREVGKD